MINIHWFWYMMPDLRKQYLLWESAFDKAQSAVNLRNTKCFAGGIFSWIYRNMAKRTVLQRRGVTWSQSALTLRNAWRLSTQNHAHQVCRAGWSTLKSYKIGHNFTVSLKTYVHTLASNKGKAFVRSITICNRAWMRTPTGWSGRACPKAEPFIS